MNSDKFRAKAYKESKNKLYAKVEAGEELTKEEHKSYKRVKGSERRQRIQWQNAKIILILFLGMIFFGFVLAIDPKISSILSVICLIVSLCFTIICYRIKKKSKELTFKFSKQLWYINIFLSMGILGGLWYSKVPFLIIVAYGIITSYIVYSATHKNEDVISND